MWTWIAAALAETGSGKIILGEDATLQDHPEVGGLLVDVGAVALDCTSTLIAPDTVLTAAHCVDDGVLGAEIANVGWSRQADLTEWAGYAKDWPPDTRLAADWVYHPEWSYAGLGLGLAENHDIALVFLEEPARELPLGWLPTAEEAEQIEDGAEVTIVGWGMRDASDTTSYGTKQIGVSAISELADYELQVGADGNATRKCHGDSGGPTFLKVESQATVDERVIGVTSHAYDKNDCMEEGGVDTRVDFYLDWIDEEMRSRCEDGSRSWCETPGILPPPIPMSDEELLADVRLVGCVSSPGGGPWALLIGMALLWRRRCGGS